MELDIIEFDGFIFGGSPLCLVVCLIIKTKFQIGHAWKLTISIDNTDDFALDDIAWWSDKHGQFFYNIQEELIFRVLNTLLSPWDYIWDLSCGIDGIGELCFLGEGVGEFIWLCFDESF